MQVALKSYRAVYMYLPIDAWEKLCRTLNNE